jgi:hypothetical protein
MPDFSAGRVDRTSSEETSKKPRSNWLQIRAANSRWRRLSESGTAMADRWARRLQNSACWITRIEQVDFASTARLSRGFSGTPFTAYKSTTLFRLGAGTSL